MPLALVHGGSRAAVGLQRVGAEGRPQRSVVTGPGGAPIRFVFPGQRIRRIRGRECGRDLFDNLVTGRLLARGVGEFHRPQYIRGIKLVQVGDRTVLLPAGDEFSRHHRLVGVFRIIDIEHILHGPVGHVERSPRRDGHAQLVIGELTAIAVVGFRLPREILRYINRKSEPRIRVVLGLRPIGLVVPDRIIVVAVRFLGRIRLLLGCVRLFMFLDVDMAGCNALAIVRPHDGHANSHAGRHHADCNRCGNHRPDRDPVPDPIAAFRAKQVLGFQWPSALPAQTCFCHDTTPRRYPYPPKSMRSYPREKPSSGIWANSGDCMPFG